jgi:hypothetical protein
VRLCVAIADHWGGEGKAVNIVYLGASAPRPAKLLGLRRLWLKQCLIFDASEFLYLAWFPGAPFLWLVVRCLSTKCLWRTKDSLELGWIQKECAPPNPCNIPFSAILKPALRAQKVSKTHVPLRLYLSIA